MEKKKLKELNERIHIEYLAEDHANYIKQILLRELEGKIELYKEAFVHGYKHAIEDTTLNNRFKKGG